MRKKGLDILRTIAIILVLFRHSDLDNMLTHFGWLGVDLFFVLSGFLVSGLLFAEYKKCSAVNTKRFLIRRGFKIFPPFYFFMISTLLFKYFFTDGNLEWQRVLSEGFYVQSYFPSIWLHTWTLAVEEHFYFTLAFCVFILSKTHVINRKKLIISSLIILLIVSFCLRLHISYPHRGEGFFGFMQTHLRSDGIIIGVLLSYLFHFTEWTKKILQYKWVSVLIATILITPALFFIGGSYFMNTIGLTTVNIGFAIVVLLSLNSTAPSNYWMAKILKYPTQLLCFIGINSYSIYLWHLNSREIINFYFDFSPGIMTFLYILLSITLGIIMSYLIEKTSLKLRDRFFRKKSANHPNLSPFN